VAVSPGRATVPAWAAPAATVLAGVAALTVVGLVDPNQAGNYPSCPVRSLTGLYCPGCGSLRALHALSHLHLGQAVGLNPLAMVMLPVVAVLWGRWAARCLGRGGPPRAAPRAIWTLLGLVVAFTIARNLPAGAALAP